VGPRGGHKLSTSVIEYVRSLRAIEFGHDDRRLYQSGSGKVWNHSSPPQPGTGVWAEQKKKKPRKAGVRFADFSEGAVSAYEGLRLQAVQPDGRVGQLANCGVLMRWWLAAWGANLGPSTTIDTSTRTTLRITGARPRLELNSSDC